MINIVIADYDIDLCHQLDEMFSAEADLNVCGTANDGEAALSLITTTIPDVVIMDPTMPRLDGMGVLERLHTLGLKTIPRVIILTAVSHDTLIQCFMALGAAYYMMKPCDPEVLIRRVRQFGPGTDTDAQPVKSGLARRHESLANAELRITRLLQEMGVPPHFKGYNYLRDAVRISWQDEQMPGGTLTKKLYPALADKYRTTPGGVEAAIRNALLATWESGNKEYVKRLGCGPVRRGRLPTNSLVIAKLVDELRMNQVELGAG